VRFSRATPPRGRPRAGASPGSGRGRPPSGERGELPPGPLGRRPEAQRLRLPLTLPPRQRGSLVARPFPFVFLSIFCHPVPAETAVPRAGGDRKRRERRKTARRPKKGRKGETRRGRRDRRLSPGSGREEPPGPRGRPRSPSSRRPAPRHTGDAGVSRFRQKARIAPARTRLVPKAACSTAEVCGRARCTALRGKKRRPEANNPSGDVRRSPRKLRCSGRAVRARHGSEQTPSHSPH